MTIDKDKIGTWSLHEPAANTAAAVSITAVSGYRICVGQVTGSYDSSPTDGSITVNEATATGTTDKVVLSITGAGPQDLPLRRPYVAATGKAVTVTLAAGGAGVTGKLTVHYWYEHE
jgi:hypothetical protein